MFDNDNNGIVSLLYLLFSLKRFFLLSFPFAPRMFERASRLSPNCDIDFYFSGAMIRNFQALTFFSQSLLACLGKIYKSELGQWEKTKRRWGYCLRFFYLSEPRKVWVFSCLEPLWLASLRNFKGNESFSNDDKVGTRIIELNLETGRATKLDFQ